MPEDSIEHIDFENLNDKAIVAAVEKVIARK